MPKFKCDILSNFQIMWICTNRTRGHFLVFVQNRSTFLTTSLFLVSYLEIRIPHPNYYLPFPQKNKPQDTTNSGESIVDLKNQFDKNFRRENKFFFSFTFFSIPKVRRPCCKTHIGDFLIFWSVASKWHRTSRKLGKAVRRKAPRFMITSISWEEEEKNRLVIQQKYLHVSTPKIL